MQTSFILSTFIAAALAQAPTTTVTLPSGALIPATNAPSTVVQVATVTSTLPAGSSPTLSAAVAPVASVAAPSVSVGVNVQVNGTIIGAAPLPVISRNGSISGVSGVVYSSASSMSAGKLTLGAVVLVSSVFAFAL